MWKVTWNELFFYNSMDCLYSEIMIFFQNVDYKCVSNDSGGKIQSFILEIVECWANARGVPECNHLFFPEPLLKRTVNISNYLMK